MDLNSFIKIYQEFLKESEQKGWVTKVLIEEFGNHLAFIKNREGIEVEFFIELDSENGVQVRDQLHPSRLNYGVIRQDGKGNSFAKEVLDAFNEYWAKHSRNRNTIHLYKP
ncbi:hypothetical protein [Neobacillus niacini]|uniref:hypothetical protein n=1 Tax=Neobacillus niacini TaxID=86668 RepID=UPI0028622873|nr:hypothetical protein [Neobacillus niacini]MDR6998975.1 hypothetical protein [Neobacillus niacini]